MIQRCPSCSANFVGKLRWYQSPFHCPQCSAYLCIPWWYRQTAFVVCGSVIGIVIALPLRLVKWSIPEALLVAIMVIGGMSGPWVAWKLFPTPVKRA